MTLRQRNHPELHPEEIAVWLSKWQSAGLLTPEEVERIEASEGVLPTAVQPTTRTPMIAEALGYVGAALVVAALSLILGQVWADLSTGIRVGALAVAAVALNALGLAVAHRTEPAARRLHALVWALSTGFVAATFGLAAADWTDWQSPYVVIVAFAPAALYSAWLWSRLHSMLLHISTFATLATVGAAVGDLADVLHDQGTPVGLLTVCALWFALTWFAGLGPYQVGLALASFVGVLAVGGLTPTRWGLVLALLLTAAIITFAVHERNILLLVIGAIGAFTTMPTAVMRFVHGPTGAGLGLLIAGAVLLSAAVVVLRRQRVDGTPTT